MAGSIFHVHGRTQGDSHFSQRLSLGFSRCRNFAEAFSKAARGEMQQDRFLSGFFPRFFALFTFVPLHLSAQEI
jgi:hypothetical protein